jgi:hypothetical protein
MSLVSLVKDAFSAEDLEAIIESADGSIRRSPTRAATAKAARMAERSRRPTSRNIRCLISTVLVTSIAAPTIFSGHAHEAREASTGIIGE